MMSCRADVKRCPIILSFWLIIFSLAKFMLWNFFINKNNFFVFPQGHIQRGGGSFALKFFPLTPYYLVHVRIHIFQAFSINSIGNGKFHMCIAQNMGKKSKDIRRVISHSEEGKDYWGWPERWHCPRWNGGGGPGSKEVNSKLCILQSPHTAEGKKDRKRQKQRDAKTEKQKGDFVQVETGEEDWIRRDE